MGKDEQKPKAIFGDQCRQKVAFGFCSSLPMRAEARWPRRLFGGTGLQKLPLASARLYPCAPKLDGQGDFLAALVSKNCLWLLLVFTHARRSSMAKATFWRHWSPKIAFGFCSSLPMRAWVKTSRSQRQFLETSAAKKSPWPSSFGAHG